MPSLTIGGKAPTFTDEKAQARFRKAVAVLLATAREVGKLDELRMKQAAWLETHEDAPQHAERLAVHETLCARLITLHTAMYLAEGAVQDAMADLQDATKADLSATYGSPVTLATPKQWGMAARFTRDATDEEILAGKAAPF